MSETDIISEIFEERDRKVFFFFFKGKRYFTPKKYITQNP